MAESPGVAPARMSVAGVQPTMVMNRSFKRNRVQKHHLENNYLIEITGQSALTVHSQDYNTISE